MTTTPAVQPIGYVNPDPAYPYKVAGYDLAGNEIRHFVDDNVQGAMNDALAQAQLGEKDHGALMAYNVGEVAKGALLIKVPTKWGHDFTFAGIVSHDFGPTGNTGVQLAARWRF